MVYPDLVKQYVNLSKVNNKFTRSGNPTPLYLEFIEFCKNNAVNIEPLAAYPFKTIRCCIEHDLLPPVCICGKATEYKKSSTGDFYATSCSFECRSKDVRYCKRISSTKTELYKNDKWKRQVEDKKIATCTLHHNVPHPMQSAVLHKKQQHASCQTGKNGLRGFEPQGLEYLLQFYADVISGTDYLISTEQAIKWKGRDNKYHRSYPDFFVNDINAFVEIKSVYTREIGEYKLMQCAARLAEMEYGYVILTISPKKLYTQETFNEQFIEET
jgi:hypothetical protein